MKQVGLQNPSRDSDTSAADSSLSNPQTKPSQLQPASSAQTSQTPDSPSREPSTIPSQPTSDNAEASLTANASALPARVSDSQASDDNNPERCMIRGFY